jgi:hypothetical protein
MAIFDMGSEFCGSQNTMFFAKTLFFRVTVPKNEKLDNKKKQN